LGVLSYNSDPYFEATIPNTSGDYMGVPRYYAAHYHKTKDYCETEFATTGNYMGVSGFAPVMYHETMPYCGHTSSTLASCEKRKYVENKAVRFGKGRKLKHKVQ
jgi:hypothetical protein